MNHKSKLSEWRENIRIRKEQEKLKSRADCQRIADAVLAGLIEKPFETKNGYSHFVYASWRPYKNHILINRGDCGFDIFKTIMQAQCEPIFGEKCVVINDDDSWNVGFYRD